MTEWVLVVTHLVAYLAGALSCFLLVRAVASRVDPEHYPPHHPKGPFLNTVRLTRSQAIALVVIVASLFVIAVGIQANLASRDNAERDREQRAYSRCLNQFAKGLADTLDKISGARADLDQAQRRKDKALDALIDLSLSAQESGASSQKDLDPKLVARYTATLRERVAAQAAYERVYAHVQAVRAANPYPPEEKCSR